MYSASHIDPSHIDPSHIDPIPGTMSSDVTNTSLTNTHLTGFTADSSQGEDGVRGQPDGSASAVSMGVSDYLNPAPSQVMLPHGDGNVGGSGEADATNDLAAELIREYSFVGEGLERKATHLVPISGVKDTKTSES